MGDLGGLEGFGGGLLLRDEGLASGGLAIGGDLFFAVAGATGNGTGILGDAVEGLGWGSRIKELAVGGAGGADGAITAWDGGVARGCRAREDVVLKEAVDGRREAAGFATGMGTAAPAGCGRDVTCGGDTGL